MKISASARTTLLLGALVLAVSMGLRHAFGLFLQPISDAQDWDRAVFALAIAVQNVSWGVAQPVAGLLSDRFGARTIIMAGAAIYVVGLLGMAWAPDAVTFTLAAGVLIGVGLATTSMSVVFGVVSRTVPAERRSMAFGVTMSIGSLGQFAMMPGVLALIGDVGWSQTLVLMSAAVALMIPLALGMRETTRPDTDAELAEAPTAGAAARLALRSRDFWLLSLGFFVCGFHVMLIATHLPAYLTDNGLDPSMGSTALALIGLFNIFGSLLAGWLGARFPKPFVLCGIYALRTVAFVVFVSMPLTPLSVVVFSCSMGVLWLSTVPLTNGIIAVMFDVRNLAMLSGFVFVAHQFGSFLGSWLGGFIVDQTGSYDMAWGAAIVLSIVAATVHMFIKERPVTPTRERVAP